MIKSVRFTSKACAENIIFPGDGHCLISIVEPGETRRLSPHWKNRVDLDFHDMDADAFNGQNWSVAESEGRVVVDWVRFNETHAVKIIKFVTALETRRGHFELIVHCHAGISRSAAVAKFVAELYDLHFPENYELYNKRVYQTLRSVFLRAAFN